MKKFQVACMMGCVLALVVLSNTSLVRAAGSCANGLIYVHITGSGNTIKANGDLYDGVKTYAFIYKPVPLQSWVPKPWIDATEAYTSRSFTYPALGLEVDPYGTPTVHATDTANDKANIQLHNFPLSQDRFTGFAVKLGHFDDPDSKIMIAQWWQGTPYGPPLSLQIVPGRGFQCEMQVRNNHTGGNPSAAVIHIPVGTCTPGEWHTFIVYARPHYIGQAGTGEVMVWHNDMSTPVADWTGDVGYDPSKPVGVNGDDSNPQDPATPNNSWNIYVGPYREHGALPKYAQTFFANILIGSSKTAADPTK